LNVWGASVGLNQNPSPSPAEDESRGDPRGGVKNRVHVEARVNEMVRKASMA
jgi:hypothetical protein